MTQLRRKRPAQVPVHPLLLYLTVTLLTTWPLAARFSTHIPGDGIDDPALTWNLWWIGERLVNQLEWDIFHVDWMFWPLGINLAFYTLTPLNGLLSLPFQFALSLPFASNTILFLTFGLAAYGGFLLTRWLLSRYQVFNREAIWWASLLAGGIYAFASPKLFYAALGQYNIASSLWIPFAVFYLLRMAERRTYRDPLLAGLFFSFQAWAELTFASFLLLFILLLTLWQVSTLLFTRRQRGVRQRLVGLARSLLLFGLSAGVGLSPFLYAMLPDLLAEGDFFTSGGGFADVFSADLLGLWVPTRLHPIFGAWTATLPFPGDKGQHLYVGYSVLLAGLAGAVWLWRTRKGAGLFWPLMVLIFTWFALGPILRIGGEPSGFPGPFTLLSQLPFFNGNRYPSRFSVMILMGASVLASFGLAALLHRLPHAPARRIVILTFGMFFLFEHLVIPLPLSKAQVPPVYKTIEAQSSGGALLELPTGWRNGARILGRSDIVLMTQQLYQTEHGLRRLGGNTSRNPEYKFTYFARAPLINELIVLMQADALDPNGEPYLDSAIHEDWEKIVSRAATIAPRVFDFLDVDFLVLHPHRVPPMLQQFVDGALPVRMVEEMGTHGEENEALLLYRTEPIETPSAWEVTMDNPMSRLFLAEGWASTPDANGFRYAYRRKVELLLDLPPVAGALTLELTDGPARLESVSLNEQPIWPGASSFTQNGLRIQIADGIADRPVDRLELRFDGLYPASELMTRATVGSQLTIGETGALLPYDRPILVQSAGHDVGDYAHIYLAGRRIDGGGRGYHLAAISGDGDLLDTGHFDTLVDPQGSAEMAAWIENLSPGTIVAGSIADEASFRLGQEATAALVALGIDESPAGLFRASHAFIGVKGAPRGTAMSQISQLSAVQVGVGQPLESDGISAGLGRIGWQTAVADE